MVKRKRKGVKAREPNGRPQRERYESPAEVRRLRDAALIGMRDPEWGTELGRLFLAGKLTAEEFAAGRHWAKLAAGYRTAMQSPSPDPKALDMDGGARGASADPDSEEGQAEAERHKRAKAAYLTADANLLLFGAKPHRAVRLVCERNEVLLDYQQLIDMKRGLCGLAAYWNLTPSRKSSHVR